MASWNLSPQYKKSAVEKQFWYKNDKLIIVEEGFRWGNFTVESDERPLTDEELRNENGYELASIDNDESWELVDMTDGCWRDVEAGNEQTTEEDIEEFEEAWEEDFYEGVEAKGWSNGDTEFWYHGPLELTNEDTGEVFKGEPEEDTTAALDSSVKVTEELETFDEVNEEDGLTDWFSADHYYPDKPGRYQVNSYNSTQWPFPTFAEWDGKKWDDDKVISWRGLLNPVQ